jgi:outer membrane lipoprotein-sorting protein
MDRRVFLGGLLGLAGSGLVRGGVVDDAPVRGWIEKARSLRSIAVEFRQERHLRAVTRPLVTAGRVWYRADGALRWELGEPPKLIALRSAAGADVKVIEPAAKTVRFFAADEAGMKGGALGLLDAGFPESYEAFDRRFRLDGIERDEGGAWRVTTLVRDTALAAAVQRMVFIIGAGTSHLEGLEVWLRDGSRIVNQFSNLRENAPVPDSLFAVATDGFRELR